MKKRVLFGVDSVFQLIIATNLRTSVYKDCEADIILYNSVSVMRQIHERLRQTNAYGKVYLADTSLAYCGNNYTFWQKLPKYFVYLWTLVAPQTALKSIIGADRIEHYGEFLFNGYGAIPDCILNAGIRINPQLKCFRFEDSYVSYFTIFGSIKGKARRIVEGISEKLFGRKNILNYIKGIYFEEPDLVLTTFPYPVIAAPKISRSNSKLLATLNYVFDYQDDEIYNKKDIYLFEDGRLFFDGNEEEVDIMKEIIDVIPKDRVVVKPHPRRKVNRFNALNVDVIKGGKTPWEIIQLNNIFDNKVFLTVSSAVAFSSDVYFGDKCYKVLLYKCLKNKPSSLDNNFERYINAYRKKFGDKSLLIPNSYEELITFFKSLNVNK